MLFLVPGVQGYRYTEESGGTSAGRTGGISVHGHRSLQNNFLLDGVDNNSISTNVQELSTQLSRPSIDAIGEFKVVTTPFTAEYGRAPGATISVTTKSGSNALRGTAYYYFRDERFDANTFFSNRSGTAQADQQPESVRRQPRRTAANGRGIFLRRLRGHAHHARRAAHRHGADRRSAPRRVHLRDSRSADRTERSRTTRFPPRASIRSPRRFSRWCRCPTRPAAATSSASRTSPTTTTASRAASICARSSNDNIFVRYSYNKRFRFVPGWFGGLLDGSSTSAWGRNDLNSQSAVAGWTKILGPVRRQRVPAMRGRRDDRTATRIPRAKTACRQIGFTGVPDENRTGGIIGVDVQGLIRMGSPNFMPKYQHTDQMQFIDTMSWLQRRAPVQVRRGNHGADEEQLRRRARHARRHRVPQQHVHGQRARGFPARAMPHRCSCRTFTKCTSASTRTRSSCRTTSERPID